MKSARRIRLLKMKRVVWCVLLLAAGLILFGITGCATDEPDNASVRPWNSPQDWEGGLPVDMNGQHR
jgi:hypothetical protein